MPCDAYESTDSSHLGEKLDYKACESLEEIFKRVQFKLVVLQQTNLDEDVSASSPQTPTGRPVVLRQLVRSETLWFLMSCLCINVLLILIFHVIRHIDIGAGHEILPTKLLCINLIPSVNYVWLVYRERSESFILSSTAFAVGIGEGWPLFRPH